MIRTLLAFAMLFVAAPVAALTPEQLFSVGISPPAGARLPLGAPLRDATGQALSLGKALDGKPSLLLFADYTCNSLCGATLGLTAAALRKSGLAAGRDYSFVVIGLDPKDAATQAQALRRRELANTPDIAGHAQFLHADAATVSTLTKALGYSYIYDAEHDQFAHPAAAFALAPDGRLLRVLDGLSLNAKDLRQALLTTLDAPRESSFVARLLQLCYGYDPSNGRYSLRILRLLSAAAVLTVTALVAGLWLASRHSRARGAA